MKNRFSIKKLITFALRFYQARMAKLVDALVSGTSDRKVVQVRVLFRAPRIPNKALTYRALLGIFVLCLGTVFKL